MSLVAKSMNDVGRRVANIVWSDGTSYALRLRRELWRMGLRENVIHNDTPTSPRCLNRSTPRHETLQNKHAR